MSGPRRLVDLLRPGDSALAPLVRRAGQREHLDRALREFLDRPLCDHVRVATVNDGTLVLAADTPVWGHRVRYLAPALLEHMRTHVAGLGQVRIIVRPASPEPASGTPSRSRPTLPASAAEALSRAAATCDNPSLARVLQRLAARAR